MNIFRNLALSVAFLMSASVALADETRAPVADVSIRNLSGETVEMSDFKGKVVVVNFWATWCGPCLQELPFLQSFHDTYGDQGLVVLAVTTDGPETQAAVRVLVRRSRWTFNVLTDTEGAVSAVLNPSGTNPFTIFVDRNGNVAHVHTGYVPGDEASYETKIQELLAESAAPAQ